MCDKIELLKIILRDWYYGVVQAAVYGAQSPILECQLMQFPADVLGKTAAELVLWTSATNMEDQDEMSGPCFSLPQPLLLWPFGK